MFQWLHQPHLAGSRQPDNRTKDRFFGVGQVIGMLKGLLIILTVTIFCGGMSPHALLM